MSYGDYPARTFNNSFQLVVYRGDNEARFIPQGRAIPAAPDRSVSRPQWVFIRSMALIKSTCFVCSNRTKRLSCDSVAGTISISATPAFL